MKTILWILLLTVINGQAFSSRAEAQPIQKQELTSGSLTKFKARPDMGFNFEYFVYLPKGVKTGNKIYMLVESTNTGAHDSIDHHEKGAAAAASKSSVGNYISRKLQIPLLVPIFPRPTTNWALYTHALDRDTLLTRDPNLVRLDLQLLAMVKDAKKQLAAGDVRTKNKFFITGFSASGTFANRFSILHPDKIQATAAGGINALAILPTAEFSGAKLDYPLGTADLRSITGKRVNLAAFKKLPKLFYMGATDTNDAAEFDDAYSDEERNIVFKLMGKQMIPHRWNFVRQVYLDNKVSADFRTYPQIGHGTDLAINNDLVEFFKRASN